MRFNPFERVQGKHGAPMGRHGNGVNQYMGGKLYAQHCGGDGYYDRGGAYWGHSRVYAVYTRGGAFCAYIEANSKEGAIKNVQKETGILSNVRLYDNGGATNDRYTAVFMDRPERAQYAGFGRPLKRLYEALGFNAAPFHPLGFGQHTSAEPGRHLGKRVELADLPEDAQKFVLQNL